MENNNTAIELASRLKEISSKNTTQAIYNKVNLAKQKSNDKETINTLEEIINDLISDKNELVQIASTYEQDFMAERLADSDIEYITRELVPIISTFVPGGENNLIISSVEKVLSPQTFKILQLIGFNFREAIGTPLTSIVAQAIQKQSSKVGSSKSSSRR